MPARAAMTRAIDAAIKRAADHGEMVAWISLAPHQVDAVCTEICRAGYSLTVAPDDDGQRAWVEVDFTGLQAPPHAPPRDNYSRP